MGALRGLLAGETKFKLPPVLDHGSRVVYDQWPPSDCRTSTKEMKRRENKAWRIVAFRMPYSLASLGGIYLSKN